MPAAGHQSASRAAGAGRAQFAGTLHHDAALEAAYGDGVYGLGGSGTASYGHTIYGHGTNVEDGDVEAAVQYFREGDDGYIPPDATNDQYYSLDMNGDTSHDRTRGRGLGRSCRFTQPRQAPSAVGRGRGRGCSRGRGLTTFVNDVQPIVSAGQNANATVVNGSTSQRSAKNPVDSQITTSYVDVYVDKNPARTSTLSGMRWLNETLNSPGNESNRRSQNRFKHSGETISRKFDEVLDAVMAMGKDFIGPKNPNFSEVYLSPDDQVRYIGKSGIPTQNPGSMHDTSVLYTAIKGDEKFFPHPPRGKYYVLDAGYPNRPGYLARYKGERYHMPE
ncbi:hypothetical protein U9M48_004161 [Paspalum notatum var. saurae]|uniref:DUF8040 domain-containing protein n=1 Tax=Paspalum notatum var. saurae TaxID=547442 RepID=A0AAQ3PPJ2_PASNO